MINNSNLVALETLDKTVLIQMIHRYRMKEELQKQKLYGLSSVTTQKAPDTTNTNINTETDKSDKSDKGTPERLRRSKSTSGMNYDVGRGRKSSTTVPATPAITPNERRGSVKESSTVLKEKTHKRGQFRGKLTLPGKSKVEKEKEKDKDKEKEKEKPADKPLSSERSDRSAINGSEKSPDAETPRKGLKGKSLTTTDRERPSFMDHSHSSSGKLTSSDYEFNITTETITSCCSLTSPKLISIKDLQEDSPVARKKVVVREGSAMQFLETISVLGETGEEACDLGVEYVQKMHQFACLVGSLRDQYPGGNGTGLENVLSKISETLCDFQSYHLEFLKSLREDFVVPVREFHGGEIKAVEGLSADYHNSLAAYESGKQKVAKKINAKNRVQCEEEIEPLAESLRHASLALSNKLNEIEMYGKPQLLSMVVALVQDNFEYIEACSSHSKKYGKSLETVGETVTSALTKVSSMVQELPVTLPKVVEEWDPKSTTIHGYMFYTTEKKGKWESAYFSIDYGYFIQMSYHNNKINKKRWNLLMSSVKPQNDANRSFVIEVTVMPVAKAGTSSSPQTILLQTESEEMRIRWITVITNAVMELLSKSKNTTDTSKQKTRIKMPLKVQKKLQNRNKHCADCGEEEPDWASINLGILFCRNCSGPHRAMGTSISKVRSITIDNWDIQSYKLIEAMGNDLLNKILLGEHNSSLPSFSEQHEREKFIRRKYETKEWMSPRETNKDSQELTNKLLSAVQKSDLTQTMILILSGANINGADKDGFTPLHLAIEKQRYLQAQLCITNGASVNVKAGEKKVTPLHIAAKNLDPIAVSQLISSGGADLEEKTSEGKTALQIALENSKGGVLDETLKLAFDGFDPSIFGHESYSLSEDDVSTDTESDFSESLAATHGKLTTSTKSDTKPGDKILSMFETLQEEST
eukprot:TRINITY_DN5210_c0_g1_i1.p1 TRINITY_DN5210_c0_g1~~TRINITY_DN5210_c0_g1_i1.p1  ORF type:complete len:927 (-),score=167.86 TRINITY_DN5210_c0_g1_i1:68-2848(-)